jgi:beta-glucanase (GH16 family)
MELLGQSPSKSYCTVHGADAAGSHVSTTQGYASTAPLSGGFHVYEAHWTATAISFAVDGQPCGTPVPLAGLQPFTGQEVMLGMAVGGSWPGPPDSTTPFPATMLVDWVRVYAG